MANLMQDIRYGVRMLTKRPGFTLVAALSLALGIGANTTIFTIVNGIFLTPIPVEDPSSLAMVFTTDSTQAGGPLGNLLPMSYPNYADIRDQNDVFEQMTAVAFTGGILAGEDEPQQIPGFMVTHEYFDVLGLEPARGRFFRPDEDDTPGADHVVVLSHGLWTRQFGADPDILGRKITLNGTPFTVVGITPEGFSGTVQGTNPDLFWVPFMTYPAMLPPDMQDWPDSRRALLMVSVIGRLKPGVSHQAADAAIETIAARLEQEYPDVNANRSAEVTEFTQLFSPVLQGQIGGLSAVLMGVVGLVLLIACANVANLLLARASTREKEIGIRLALGAGRHRLVRQLLTESVLLALLGGVLGLVLAFWAGDIVAGLAGGFAPGGFLNFDVGNTLDYRVLGFTLGVALLTGVVFGLAPALQTTNPRLAGTLQEGGRGGSSGARQQLVRSSLVVGEIAVALVALICAGLFIRSMQAAQEIDPGFETHRLATLGVNPVGIGYEQGRAEQFYEELIQRAESMGRVESAALASVPPLGFGPARTVIPLGWDDEDGKYATNIMVSPGYFESAGIPLVRGRDFTAFDDADSRRVAILNETAARTYWPDQDPLGQRFHFITEDDPVEVVGVAADVIAQIGQPVQPAAYQPYRQRFQGLMFLHARTTGDPEPVLAELQDLVREIDASMPVNNPATVEQTLDAALQQSRVIAGLLGVMGGLGLVLALIGTYGLMSYAVNQQSREIGIRMALGARGNEVMGLVIRKGMVLVALGVGIGVLLSLGVTRLLGSMLVGVSTTDWITFLGVPLLLVTVGLLANLIPARRVLRVDPVNALKAE